jgi:putative ABC transport system substrate-binding protein
MNRRRALAALLGVGIGPLSAFAQQQGKAWRIGYLSSSARATLPVNSGFETFRLGMRELGYIEGKNLVIEARSANGVYERLPGLAAELVELKVDVILADASPAIRAAQKATTTIPIVMGSTGDPVGSGFVQSLARPGGNITGLALMSSDASAKLLDLLREVVPHLSRVAVLVSPTSSTYRAIFQNVETAGKDAGIEIVPVEAQTPLEIESGFASIARTKVGAVIIGITPFLIQQYVQIVELAAKYRLPSISGDRRYPETGGLMSYGQSIMDNFRRAATYVDKILKGASPGELPVEQPTKFELVINLKTAKALGLTVPQSLLLRADEVIQ